jgi:hypothetical protein
MRKWKWEFVLCMAALSTAACNVSVSTGESKRSIDADEVTGKVRELVASLQPEEVHCDPGEAQLLPGAQFPCGVVLRGKTYAGKVTVGACDGGGETCDITFAFDLDHLIVAAKLEDAVHQLLAGTSHAGAHVDCGAALQSIPSGGVALCDVRDGDYRDHAQATIGDGGTITGLQLMAAEAG